MQCLETANGKPIWQRDLVGEEDARLPTWGFSGAPVIHGERLLLNVGETGMALSKSTGKTIWKSPRRNAGYSTPVSSNLQNRIRYFFFRQAVHCRGNQNGETIQSYRCHSLWR